MVVDVRSIAARNEQKVEMGERVAPCSLKPASHRRDQNFSLRVEQHGSNQQFSLNPTYTFVIAQPQPPCTLTMASEGGVTEDDPTALNSLSKFTLFETKR